MIEWLWVDPAASTGNGWLNAQWVATTHHALDAEETFKSYTLQTGGFKVRRVPGRVASASHSQRVVDGGEVFMAHMPGNEKWYFVQSVDDAYKLWDDGDSVASEGED